MINKWKTTSVRTKASITYTLANLLTKGIVFLSIPIFTRLMSTSEVGIATTYNAWQSLIFPVITLSISSGSLNIAMMEFPNDRDKYQSSVMGISITSTIFWSSVFCLFANQISSFMALSKELCIVILLSCLLTPAMEIFLARQRYEYNYKIPAFVSLISAGGSIMVAIVIVVLAQSKGFTNLGTIRVVSQNIFIFCICLMLCCYMFYKGKTLFCEKYWKFAFLTSIPLIFHTLSKQVMDVSDRAMIASMCGISEAGIYGTIYTISSMALIVWTAINNSLIPYMFEKIREKSFIEINTTINPILLMFSGFTILLTLSAPDIIRILLPSQYYEAVYIIPAVAGGIFLTTLYNLFSNVLLYYKKTNYIMIATTVAAIVNIGLNYCLIPKFGYLVASYTTLVSYIILAVLQYVMMRRVSTEPIFPSRKLAFLSGITILSNLLCILLYDNGIARLVVLLLVVVVFFSSLWFMHNKFRRSN